MDEATEPTGRALDARVAEKVMRWRVEPSDVWDGNVWLMKSPPHYSTDRNAADGMEDEIARRGLEREYLRALVAIVIPRVEEATRNLWYASDREILAMARATPEQRCRAALAAVERGAGDA